MIIESLAYSVLIGLATLVAYFIVLTAADLFRRSRNRGAPHCIHCTAARMIPLLDSSLRFHGEYACLRCGETNRIATP